MDKELALAIDFKKAPKELQDAANLHYTNAKNVAKLRKQIVETNIQLEQAERTAGESEKALRSQLKLWTPEV